MLSWADMVVSTFASQQECAQFKSWFGFLFVEFPCSLHASPYFTEGVSGIITMIICLA